MSVRFKDHSGEKYNRWNIIEPTEKFYKNQRLWKCVCDCQLSKPENERDYKEMPLHNILSGISKSCGCYKSEHRIGNQFNKHENQYEYSDNGYMIGTIRNGYKFYIDNEDYELVKQYCWHQHRDGYLRTCYESYYDDDGKKHNKYILMHRLIASVHGFGDKMEIDHINGIPYDNRLCNLRSVTHAQNMKNLKLCNNNTSGHKGVHYSKNEKKWKAFIIVDGKQTHLGTFSTYKEAVEAREKAEKRYFKEFKRASEDLLHGTSNADNEGHVA